MRKRKLQVFVSSTYTDLVDDRSAAIEAILAAHHIPAAMEQFSPGDETAWGKIRRWIDESDCFMLILGGRYGSLEPNSGKSYVQLEYEYALDNKKPYFSLLITEAAFKKRVKSRGLDVDERENQEKYKQFKDQLNVQHCGFWDDWKDIRSHILQKILTDWSQRDDLIGWVRGDEAVNPEVTNELARLSRENSELRATLAARQESFGGLDFDDLVKLLCQDKTDFSQLSPVVDADFRSVIIKLGLKQAYTETNVFSDVFKHSGYIFDIFMDYLSNDDIHASTGMRDEMSSDPAYYLMGRLVSYGLVTREMIRVRDVPVSHCFSISDIGRKFRHRLLLVGDRDTRDRLLWSPPKESQSTLPPLVEQSRSDKNRRRAEPPA
jgi:hypothetical protein